MKRTMLLLFIIAVFFSSASSQTVDFINGDIQAIATSLGWDISTLNTAKNEKYMTQQEKDVVLCMNMARANPKKFTNDFIVPLESLFDGKSMSYPGGESFLTSEGVSAVKELIRQLPEYKKAAPLKPSVGLRNAAADLVAYQEKTGKTGHTGEKGATMGKRIAAHGTSEGITGENVSYGEHSALTVVVSLLIDDGISSRGHRDNIMGVSLQFVGVKWGSHPSYGPMCAMTFAAGFTER